MKAPSTLCKMVAVRKRYNNDVHDEVRQKHDSLRYVRIFCWDTLKPGIFLKGTSQVKQSENTYH